jgi:hypothetical protein
LGTFVIGLLLAGFVGWVSDTGAGLLGTFGLLGFLMLGLPLTVALVMCLERKEPAWAYGLAYLGLAVVTGLGSWVLLGYLTKQAKLRLQQVG